MHDTSKGCILWFCLILFFFSRLGWMEMLHISLGLALCRGKPRWKEFSSRTWIAWSWVELSTVFLRKAPGFSVGIGTMETLGNFGFHFHASRWLWGGRGVFCILFFSFIGRWHMIQWFSSSCLPAAVRSLEPTKDPWKKLNGWVEITRKVEERAKDKQKKMGGLSTKNPNSSIHLWHFAMSSVALP